MRIIHPPAPPFKTLSLRGLPSVTLSHTVKVTVFPTSPSPCRGSWTTHNLAPPDGAWTQDGTLLTVGTSHALQHALRRHPLLPHPHPLLLAINASSPTLLTKPGTALFGRYATGARTRGISLTHVATPTLVAGPAT